MCIARELGLESIDPLDIVQAHWSDWATAQPALLAVKVPTDLPAWTERVRDQASEQVHCEVNEVLRSLATLGASDGGDDPQAALVLAWLMLPAAAAVARRHLRRNPRLIDQVVAARLWVEVRTFGWRTRNRVAANIAMDLERGVIQDLNALGLEANAQVIDPSDMEAFLAAPVADENPRADLLDLLDDAIEDGVIGWGERALLLTITDTAAAAPSGRTSQVGVAGLLTEPVERAVHDLYHLSGRSLRRRAGECVEALARYKRVQR
jgi:hypothetical protein